jgi:lipoate-protein ligase A
MQPLLLNELNSGARSGAYNMALDDYLLERHRAAPEQPSLIVRTYGWTRPTLSLGLHQRTDDLPLLLRLYGADVDLVRRPTGGRAIRHGEDISFSFVTNEPALLKQPLKQSYCVFIRFIKAALTNLGVEIAEACEQDGRAYTRSPVCFETQTPSDLTDKNGHKLVGSAQARRAGGILQHGAVFLQPYGISHQQFTQALFQAVAAHYGQASLAEYPAAFESDPVFLALQERYLSEASGILASASTTSGSHLIPASR